LDKLALNRVLYDALLNEDFYAAKFVVKSGAKIFTEGNNDTYIHILVRERKKNKINTRKIIRIFKFIICNYDLDINIKNRLGNTFLHEACMSYYGSKDYGFKKIIIFLLVNGACLTTCNAKEETPYKVYCNNQASSKTRNKIKYLFEKKIHIKTFKEILDKSLVRLASKRSEFLYSNNFIVDVYLLIFYYFMIDDNEEESNKIFCVCKNYYNSLNLFLKNADYIKRMPIRQKFQLFKNMHGKVRNLPRTK
jgi:hypothetical protein